MQSSAEPIKRCVGRSYLGVRHFPKSSRRIQLIYTVEMGQLTNKLASSESEYTSCTALSPPRCESVDCCSFRGSQLQLRQLPSQYKPVAFVRLLAQTSNGVRRYCRWRKICSAILAHISTNKRKRSFFSLFFIWKSIFIFSSTCWLSMNEYVFVGFIIQSCSKCHLCFAAFNTFFCTLAK